MAPKYITPTKGAGNAFRGFVNLLITFVGDVQSFVKPVGVMNILLIVLQI